MRFFNHSPSQDMQHCLWTGCLQLEDGQRFLSHRTEPSRQTHTAHGSDASSQVSPLARSRPSYRQPAREMRRIENMIRLKKSAASYVTEELRQCCRGGLLLQWMTQCASAILKTVLSLSWQDFRNCTFAGPTALLCDGVGTCSKGAGLALTVN